MWYFAWILGIGFAASLGIINAMWYEFQAGGYDVVPEERDDYQITKDA